MSRDASAVLGDLLATMPRCSRCDAPATRAFYHGDRFCDQHNTFAPELPHAQYVREGTALLRAHLIEDRPLHERLAQPLDAPIPYVPTNSNEEQEK